MHIKARVSNSQHEHVAQVSTDGRIQALQIAAKPSGFGSSINGGELLFAALATCFCNDLYREAAKRGIEVASVEVEVEGHFAGPGEPARDISYRANVVANATPDVVAELIRTTDQLTEIQNTLRAGCAVRLITD